MSAGTTPGSGSQSTFLTSDILLASLLPLFLLVVVLKVFQPLGGWSELLDLLSLRPSHRLLNDGMFSLRRAYLGFTQYPHLSHTELARMRGAYSALGRKSKRLGSALRYGQKLDKLKTSIEVNSLVAERIAELAVEEMGVDRIEVGMMAKGIGSQGELMRVREALKHYVRDWSEDGIVERERTFGPILDVLRREGGEERGRMRVLVPGSGLGRLAWEISKLGYDTTANELSYYMNLAFRFLLSEKTTALRNQHKIRPYAHWFSHQRSNESLFRAISFPDEVPRLGPKFHLVEKDFLTLPTKPTKSAFWSQGPSPSHSPSASTSKSTSPQGSNSSATDTGEGGQFDFIVTLFFIDTSLDVFATLDQIHALLKPGGTWINLGPLLWTSGAQAMVELSLDEVLRAAEEIGFTIHGENEEDGVVRRRSVECEYTADMKAMMRWVYKAEFWVARKSKL
ncbi:hypothetical protein AX16_002985 [Volvariella volvacea WC 439]|nr:hypothetical protein AX16_002985 [Volvariella volvacea WC 439]